jgi:hypothetical protein
LTISRNNHWQLISSRKKLFLGKYTKCQRHRETTPLNIFQPHVYRLTRGILSARTSCDDFNCLQSGEQFRSLLRSNWLGSHRFPLLIAPAWNTHRWDQIGSSFSTLFETKAQMGTSQIAKVSAPPSSGAISGVMLGSFPCHENSRIKNLQKPGWKRGGSTSIRRREMKVHETDLIWPTTNSQGGNIGGWRTNVLDAVTTLDFWTQCIYLAFKISDTPTRPKMPKISQGILLLAVAFAEKTRKTWSWVFIMLRFKKKHNYKYNCTSLNYTTATVHYSTIKHRHKKRRDKGTFFPGRSNGVKHQDWTVEHQGFKF